MNKDQMQGLILSSCTEFFKNDNISFIERGPCLPTIALWLLFVYVEASLRLREIKSLPFHLDICRPFAAHW